MALANDAGCAPQHRFMSLDPSALTKMSILLAGKDREAGMSLIDSSRVEQYLARVVPLQADCLPRWGGMSAAAMISHVNHALECSIGERDGGQYGPLWLGPLLKPFALMPLPIPHGLPTTPQLVAATSRDLDGEKERFIRLLRRVHREVLGNPGARHPHPAFGLMTRLEWARLQDRHLGHHFRQFGL